LADRAALLAGDFFRGRRGEGRKAGRASPHWMRHIHASHSLARRAELTSVCDNLRHASLSTTSIYLHGDEVKRARQLSEAFPERS
jgi:site-specific recombinase XerC